MTATRPTAALLGAIAASLISASATAKTCAPTPGAPQDPVAASVWADTAQFSFLVGSDFDDPGSNTVLIARLRPFSGYPTLRRDAGAWPATYAEIGALAAAIGQSRANVNVIGGLCKNLDDASFGATTFDRVAWTKSVDAVRARVDGLATRALALVAALHNFSTILAAAASNYANAGYAVNPSLRLETEPPAVARDIAELWLRWRAIAADLQFASAHLPESPDTASDAGLLNLTSAATTLANAADSAGAIARTMPAAASTSRLFTGDYLYDACPIEDGRSYYLSNEYYQQTDGVLTGVGNTVLILAKGAPLPFLSSVVTIDQLQSWRFRKTGSGYWSLQSELPTPAPQFLDVLNDAAQFHPLLLGAAADGRPGFTGQFWRCYATQTLGRYRFSNRFLGETFSIDTFNNKPQAIMAATGNYAAQYWGLITK